MGKPYGDSFRADILSTFDVTPIQTIQGVVSTLTSKFEELNTDSPDSKFPTYNPSYQATRRMMQKMVKENLLDELPKRGPKNQTYYVKGMFKNITRFADMSGNNVSLKEFIHKLTDPTNDPQVIAPNAMKAIKTWMLDSLGASIPDSYEELNKPIPSPVDLRSQLEVTLQMTRDFHAFIKAFLDADIWSPVAQERLATEFKSTCVEEHSVIVDRSWQ